MVKVRRTFPAPQSLQEEAKKRKWQVCFTRCSLSAKTRFQRKMLYL